METYTRALTPKPSRTRVAGEPTELQVHNHPDHVRPRKPIDRHDRCGRGDVQGHAKIPPPQLTVRRNVSPRRVLLSEFPYAPRDAHVQCGVTVVARVRRDARRRFPLAGHQRSVFLRSFANKTNNDYSCSVVRRVMVTAPHAVVFIRPASVVSCHVAMPGISSVHGRFQLENHVFPKANRPVFGISSFL